MSAIQERFDAFVRDFVAPLCAGGQLSVRLPLGGKHLAHFTSGAVPDAVAEARIIDARDAIAADLVSRPPVLAPLHQDEPALRVAAVAHNIVALSHPRMTKGVLGRRTARRVARFTAEMLAGIPAADTMPEAVSLHSLLWNLPRLVRTDRVVKYWAGTRRYSGQQPPHRMVRWPRLRRVSIKEERHRWQESLLTIEQRDLLTGLMRRSPITDLVNASKSFQLTPALLALQHPELARFIVDALVRRFRDAELCAALAGALVTAALRSTAEARLIRFFASVLVHVVMTVVWTSGQAGLDAAGESAEPLLGVVGILVAIDRESDQLGIPNLELEADPRLVAVSEALTALSRDAAARSRERHPGLETALKQRLAAVPSPPGLAPATAGRALGPSTTSAGGAAA
jgi:hypothetical protein